MRLPILSSIEALEARIAPAGLVKVLSSGGNVTVTGDAAPNDIKVELFSPGQLKITGNGTTQVQFGNGAPSSSVTVLYGKNLSVALRDGPDRVELATGGYYGNVLLDGGIGDNLFVVDEVMIPGGLTVLAKGGGDTLTIAGGATDVQIGRDFTVKLGDGQNISNATTTGRLIVGGKLIIAGGKDAESFHWDAKDIVVGGDTSIKTGKGLDIIDLHATDTLGLSGKLTIVGGDSVPPGAQAVVGASYGMRADNEMTVRGAVSVTTVAGNAVSVLGGTNQTLFAAGVTMKTGKGSNTVSIEGKVQTVLGNVAITAGGATNFTMSPATSFFVSGGLTFKGSKLTDAFTLTGLGTITGKLSVDLGTGAAQTATLTGAVGSGFAVLGDVTVKQGESTGTSLTKISGVGVGGKLAVTTSGANDTVRIDSANVFGATTIGTGAGGDILDVETLAVAGPSVFGGLVKIALGAGADAATFGNSSVDDRVNLTIPGVIDAGTGTDTVLFGGRGNVGTLNILNVP